MAIPLEDYKPIGTSDAQWPQHKPERYLWLIFSLSLLVNSGAGLIYGTSRFPYHNILRVAFLVSWVAFFATGLIRHILGRRLTH